MRTLKTGQRVEIDLSYHPLHGERGTVVRRRMADNGAWVKMDNELPDDCREFPKDDPRGNNFLLFPEECRAVKP